MTDFHVRGINVLDKGFVKLVNVMGDDLTPVNAAKVSYDRRSYEYGSREQSLTKFLADNGHTSPFRHATLQFEVYAPLMVARQWWKYVVGSAPQDPITAWNESSRRYITEDVTYYIVEAHQWRSAPDNKKQGSGLPLPEREGQLLTNSLVDHYVESTNLYEEAMRRGVCAEQARLFLPAYGMYVRWIWTVSLQGVAHFINQRVAHDAQKEIQLYAEAIRSLASEHFPHSLEALLDVHWTVESANVYIQFATQQYALTQGQIFIHKGNKKAYIFQGFSKHSETLEPHVDYTDEEGGKWSRPAPLFFERFNRLGIL